MVNLKNMKLYLRALVLLMTLSFSSFTVYETISVPCVQKLTDGFLFLKSYKLEKTFEFSYVLAKGNTYKFLFCSGENLVSRVELFDASRNKVFTIQDKNLINDTGIAFQCQASGIYYIKCYDGAGEVIMDFRR